MKACLQLISVLSVLVVRAIRVPTCVCIRVCVPTCVCIRVVGMLITPGSVLVSAACMVIRGSVAEARATRMRNIAGARHTSKRLNIELFVSWKTRSVAVNPQQCNGCGLKRVVLQG